MDPVTAIAAASTAFSLIKKGFEAGRDVESMYSDIGRWMGACSDVNHSVKMAANPPVFKKLFAGSSVEQEAMDAFAAKKTIVVRKNCRTKAKKKKTEIAKGDSL